MCVSGTQVKGSQRRKNHPASPFRETGRPGRYPILLNHLPEIRSSGSCRPCPKSIAFWRLFDRRGPSRFATGGRRTSSSKRTCEQNRASIAEWRLSHKLCDYHFATVAHRSFEMVRLGPASIASWKPFDKQGACGFATIEDRSSGSCNLCPVSLASWKLFDR